MNPTRSTTFADEMLCGTITATTSRTPRRSSHRTAVRTASLARPRPRRRSQEYDSSADSAGDGDREIADDESALVVDREGRHALTGARVVNRFDQLGEG
jgi:hypothetical protein